MTRNDVCSMLVVYTLFDPVLQNPSLFLTNFQQVCYEISFISKYLFHFFQTCVITLYYKISFMQKAPFEPDFQK